jgi:hypothetical protein
MSFDALAMIVLTSIMVILVRDSVSPLGYGFDAIPEPWLTGLK